MKRSELSLIALRRILRATELYGRELARAAGLTAVQIRVLQIVAETGQSTPKTIATRMGVSQATMTTLIDRLVAKGLVDRRRSEADRRQMNIAITPEGRAAIDRAPDPLHDRYVTAFEKLPDYEQAMLVAALERVAALLDAGHLDAAPVLDLGDIRKTLPEE
ncbi:MarR family transcriptional regulator [Rhodovulum sp. BSW8]|uniref:MarR family transcriptional regulator n=1 Tax=Rhodovulum visakhapatnamense TaxID=364297 RepID=A0A4R8FNL4_9RHOB|nr:MULTISPECIES: MarR family transcriptional regulator [Rhodovulum]OLS44377.1 MarR family transcriptional regulator [Rhodovulum sulfidophilum]MBL3569196.1 MarR family transcriptional regulator [Rhodovulum visakhapatnamense]MBL3578688.1 MarR family transcriptional regulator [Rhodovulum visakhapatnamense]RBO52237.1 MarR family transcriptional regulator [Rhodovulum sp. BSW8]TDX27944.1 DNA-binding MarR family transcriptional regulator [Rhodovulum visakhapatnamense]